MNPFKCSTCNRLRLPLLPHGSLKRERVIFPDGGWFRWSRFAPCSATAPSGNPAGPLLDDDEDYDLDSIRSQDTSNVEVGFDE